MQRSTELLTGMTEVDELGVLLNQLAPLQRRERELKDALKAKGHTVIEGALFRCTVSESIEERLDTRAIKAEMGADWCSARAKAVVKETVRVAAKTAG